MLVQYDPFSRIIKQIVINSIEENFESDGRWGNGILGGGTTSWEKSLRAIKQGGKTLQDTGMLASSVQVNVKSSGGLDVGVENENIISIETEGGWDITATSNRQVGGVKLSDIHGLGGKWKVPVTKKMKGYFWHKYAEEKDDKWKFMALSKKSEFDIFMPARPFLVLQDFDIDHIHDRFVDWIRKS